MSLFTTYLEQVKTEMNPDELNLKKLAMEIIKISNFYSTGYGPEDIEFMKFLFYKLAIKSTKFNTIQLWDKFEKVLENPGILKGSIKVEDNERTKETFFKTLKKFDTPESEMKRASRIFNDDKFIEDNKIPFFTKLAEEKTNNKQLIKKIIKDIWG